MSTKARKSREALAGEFSPISSYTPVVTVSPQEWGAGIQSPAANHLQQGLYIDL